MTITQSVLCILIVGVDSVQPVLVVPLPTTTDGGEEAEEAVVEDLRCRDQGEPHAQTKKTS